MDSRPKKLSTWTKSRDVAAETPIEAGCSLQAAISHNDGLDYFYMQRLDTVGEIQRFQDDLQSYYKKVSSVYNVSHPLVHLGLKVKIWQIPSAGWQLL